jgi:hypothetical protein
MTTNGEPNDEAAEALNVAADGIAQVMMSMAVATAPVLEAVAGYRSQLKADGYTDDACSSMAADYHHWIIANLIRGLR